MFRKRLLAFIFSAGLVFTAGCGILPQDAPDAPAEDAGSTADTSVAADSVIASGSGEIWDDSQLFADAEEYKENMSPDGTDIVEDFDLGKCIDLCGIDGLEVPVLLEAIPTEEDARVQAKLSKDAKPRGDDWEIGRGDVVSVDMTAYIDGEEEPEISRTDAQIFVGAHGTNRDIEEALIGLTKGMSREFDVTYDDDYLFMDLGGKTVTYRVHVNSVASSEEPDDSEIGAAMDLLMKANTSANEERRAQAVKDAIREHSEIKAYPEKLVRQARARYERMCFAGYGSIDDYLNESGMTRAEFKKEEDGYVSARVKDDLILLALEEETGITAESSEFNDYIAMHGMNGDDISETQFKAIVAAISDRISFIEEYD